MSHVRETKRNWVAIAVRLLGGIYPAARACRVRPTTLKRWYGRGWVEIVDKALLLARAAKLPPLRLLGFDDVASVGERRAQRRRMILPYQQRRRTRIAVSDSRRQWRYYGSARWVDRRRESK